MGTRARPRRGPAAPARKKPLMTAWGHEKAFPRPEGMSQRVHHRPSSLIARSDRKGANPLDSLHARRAASKRAIESKRTSQSEPTRGNKIMPSLTEPIDLAP